jgi:hypothetical protein
MYHNFFKKKIKFFNSYDTGKINLLKKYVYYNLCILSPPPPRYL